ncbi:hypothetical protein BGZ82_004028 [Podila clonocystis]|nr:hypothetical protein BGZ82_004028 [Podila clonocystis]
MPSRPSHLPKETAQVSSKAHDQVRSGHDEAPSRKTKSVRILSPVPLSRSGPSQPVALLPPLTLPITRDTLRELDLFEIFKNPQLRHDIVFDPHLQFRPNFDGERGLIKKREADRFWREVEMELNTRQTAIAMRREAAATMLSLAGLSSSSSRLIQQEKQQKCPLPTPNLLPKLIDELREILLSLLPVPPPQDGKGPQPPNPERALLASTLDPQLLLQELDHGVLDVHGLFRYLGDSLKGHCAPMRDAFVESMVAAVVQSGEIVRGIRMCFEILELMKLDIANHQLRTLRPWLLDNSIDFEQKYFTEQLARGGSLQRTQDWFKRSWIRWESVKQSVLGNVSSSSSLSLSSGPSRRGSLAPISPPASVSSQSDLDVKEVKSFPHAALMGKRRPSIVTADIGENILDGVVNEGLLDMILRPHGSVNTMPETFELDHYRLLSFHNDFQDLTILCTLLILFRQLARNCWTQQDLIEIKKVVWLLLTDENANFGVNSNTGSGKKSKDPNQSYSTASSGMKDIVIQIEFAARKVRERNAIANAAAGSRRSSLAPVPTTPTSLESPNPFRRMSTGPSLIPTPLTSPATSTAPTPLASPTPTSGLSASDTNLLTSWLDNALSRTSTLYTLIQKRLMIHFRRWLYLHSCSSILVLSASCASLASAISMSSGLEPTDINEDEDDPPGSKETKRPPTLTISTAQASTSSSSQGTVAETETTNAPVPEISPEEANKAAAEALASKLSFNTTEMEAHGLTGLEDEMTALLEKIRAVTEFNKKVYGSWYRELVIQGRSENWLEVPQA